MLQEKLFIFALDPRRSTSIGIDTVFRCFLHTSKNLRFHHVLTVMTLSLLQSWKSSLRSERNSTGSPIPFGGNSALGLSFSFGEKGL